MALEHTTEPGDDSNPYQEYIQRIKNRDPETWDMLVKSYATRLEKDIYISLAKRNLGPEYAFDVQQQTWLVALRLIPGFEWRGDEAFYHWLRKISLNVIHEHRRDQRESESLADAEDDSYGSDLEWFFQQFGLDQETLEDITDLRRFMAVLDEVLRKILNPYQREIYLRWKIGDDKPRHLTIIYNEKSGSLRQMLARAHKKVLEEMRRRGF